MCCQWDLDLELLDGTGYVSLHIVHQPDKLTPCNIAVVREYAFSTFKEPAARSFDRFVSNARRRVWRSMIDRNAYLILETTLKKRIVRS